MELGITIGLLVVELVIVGVCYSKIRRPVQPGRVRLVPYNGVMVFTVVVAFATIAHLSGLLGHPITPRTSKYGN